MDELRTINIQQFLVDLGEGIKMANLSPDEEVVILVGEWTLELIKDYSCSIGGTPYVEGYEVLVSDIPVEFAPQVEDGTYEVVTCG